MRRLFIRRLGSAVLVGGLMTAGLALAPSASAASTLVVDDDLACPGATFTSVQAAITAAAPGDTVMVCTGTYSEQLTIDKDLTIQGEIQNITVIQAPATLVESSCLTPGSGQTAIVEVCNGANVTMSKLTVSGPGPGTCGSIGYGIFVGGGSTLDVSLTNVAKIRDEPMSGCQNGVAVGAGRTLFSQVGHLVASQLTITEHQKIGIVVDGTGSDATITGSTVQGVGATPLIAENGVQVSRGATATVSGNTITAHECDHTSCGPDPLTQTQSIGVLLSNAGAGTVVQFNSLSSNDIAVYNTTTGTTTINDNTIFGNRYVGVFLDQGNADLVRNSIGAGNIGVLVTSFTGNTANSTGTMTSNAISGATQFGVRVVDDDVSDAFKPVAGGSLNQFSGNAAGVKNETPTLLDFRKNWWGDGSGPSDWSIGTGDSVSSDVQFFPWIKVLADDFNPNQFAVCTISGNNSPNVLNGTAGNDIICGKGGNDTINGQGGNDLVIGDGGNDLLKGGPGNDAILGTSGNDDLRGNAGFDSIQGGPGTDTCSDPDLGQKTTCELP
jgi:hypothetical protein